MDLLAWNRRGSRDEIQTSDHMQKEVVERMETIRLEVKWMNSSGKYRRVKRTDERRQEVVRSLPGLAIHLAIHTAAMAMAPNAPSMWVISTKGRL